MINQIKIRNEMPLSLIDYFSGTQFFYIFLKIKFNIEIKSLEKLIMEP